MKVYSFICLLCSLVLLSGCASIDPVKLTQEADRIGYGAPPTDVEAKVRACLELRLKDPASAIYKFGQPQTAWVSKAPIAGGGLDTTGWLVQVLVNAKNSYGGYTGFKTYQFLFRDGRIVRLKSQEGLIWETIN